MEWGTWAEWANSAVTLVAAGAAIAIVLPTARGSRAAAQQAKVASDQLAAYIDDMRVERELASRDRAAQIHVMWTHDRQNDNQMVLLADNPTGQPMRKLSVLVQCKGGGTSVMRERLEWNHLPQGQWRARWEYQRHNAKLGFSWCKPAEPNRFSPSQARGWVVDQYSFMDSDGVEWCFDAAVGTVEKVAVE